MEKIQGVRWIESPMGYWVPVLVTYEPESARERFYMLAECDSKGYALGVKPREVS